MPECVGFSEIGKVASGILKYQYPNVTNYGDATGIVWEDVPDFDLLVGGTTANNGKEKKMAKEEILRKNTFPHLVEMPLTDKELLAYADELTTLDTEQREAEAHLQSEKGSHKQKIETITERQTTILHRLRTKKELKEVECIKHFEYFEGICEIRRADNGEVVITRKMTPDEAKGEPLPFEIVKKDDEDEGGDRQAAA